jgi:hypothetical protein
MAPIYEAELGSGGNPSQALRPLVSMVVVMNTSSMFATSLLDQASFHNFFFQLGFLMSQKKTLV